MGHLIDLCAGLGMAIFSGRMDLRSVAWMLSPVRDASTVSQWPDAVPGGNSVQSAVADRE